MSLVVELTPAAAAVVTAGSIFAFAGFDLLSGECPGEVGRELFEDLVLLGTWGSVEGAEIVDFSAQVLKLFGVK